MSIVTCLKLTAAPDGEGGKIEGSMLGHSPSMYYGQDCKNDNCDDGSFKRGSVAIEFKVKCPLPCISARIGAVGTALSGHCTC